MSLATRASEFREGAAVEVAIDHALGGTKTYRGRFVMYHEPADVLHVRIGGQLCTFRRSRVRYLSPVDEMLHAASFTIGDTVRITKYGGQYVGTVEDVYKTRLDVSFVTLGGKMKRPRVPAIDCERA